MTDVCIPWVASDTARTAALRWVTEQYLRAGMRVRLGVPISPDPWVKAHAVGKAVAQAPYDEVVVVADADVWVATEALRAACQAVEVGRARWAVPHRSVRRLAPDATCDLYAGDDMPHDGLRLAEPPHLGHLGGGIVVLRRSDYGACPLDPRFVGWGQEDDAWAYALKTMLGKPWRGTATLWHLWHAPQPRQSRRVGSAAGEQLARRYKAAMGNRPRMAALLSEAMAAA